MSLVGPRPEVPEYVSLWPTEIRNIILSVRPGITDRASIEFRDENLILGMSKDPHSTYVAKVLPIKLQYYQKYARNNSVLGDICIIFSTFLALFR